MLERPESRPKKRSVNLTIREDVLNDAKLLGLNVSQVSEQAVIQAIKIAKEKAWLEDNKEAIAAHNKRVDDVGTLIVPWWLKTDATV